MNKEEKEKLRFEIKKAHIRAGNAEDAIKRTFYMGKLAGINEAIKTAKTDPEIEELKEHIMYTINWMIEYIYTEQGKKYYKAMKEEMMKKGEW